jgi:hypothetical protein
VRDLGETIINMGWKKKGAGFLCENPAKLKTLKDNNLSKNFPELHRFGYH